VWEKVEVVRDEQGVERQEVSRYRELGDGICYWDETIGEGAWADSEELIQIVNGKGMALKGQQKAMFAAQLDDPEGAVQIWTKEGVRFRAAVLALAYYDWAQGKDAILATARGVVGEQIGPNQILYRDAFLNENVRADVLMTYTKRGVSQWVVIRERPPDPSRWLLLPEATRLEVLTEILESVRPQKRRVVLDRVEDPVLAAAVAEPEWVDEELDFGPFAIRSGLQTALA
jgi:hypothetical protein